MDNKLVMISIAAVIGIIVLGSVLMPILDDATTVNETFSNKNDALGYYQNVDLTEDTVTLVWDHTKPTKITVNDNEFDLPDVTSYINGVSLIVTEGLALRYYVQSGERYFLQSIGVGNAGAYGYASTTNNTDLSITLDSSGWTYNKTTPVTTTVTGNVFVISETGDFVMKNPASNAYLLEDSSTAALGVTVIGGVWVIMGWNSDNGSEIQPEEYYPPDGYVISATVVDSSEVSGYEGLSTINKVTFTATKADDSTVSGNVTYSYFIVPAEVTAERSIHFTPGQNAIFASIPVMIILAVLLGVVALVIRSRMD